MRRALGMVAVLLVAVAAGLGISVAIHHRAVGSGPGPATSSPDGATTMPPVEIVPGAGQAFVTGTITSLTADNAIGPALKAPFTITIPNRGQGSADITGVLVGGKDMQIFWYGGQPLPVSGTGSLAVDGGGLTVDGSGITWLLDGAARSLTAGHFALGAPVAVGAGGLAQARQGVAFEAGDRSTIQTTGKARVHLPPASIHVDGPGSVTLHGDLQVQTTAGTRRVQTVVFGPGSYAIDLAPAGGGDSIKATLQGPATFGP